MVLLMQEEIQKMKVTVEAMTPNDSGLTAREIRLQKDYDNILRERDAVNEELMVSEESFRY